MLLVCPALVADRIEPTALPPATMEQLASVDVPLIPRAEPEREHARSSIAAAVQSAVEASVVLSPQATAPPPVTRGFQAVTDPLPNANFVIYPADASGAVGPNHVVGLFNNAVTIHDRTGNLLSLVTVAQFWHDATLPDKSLYDPRVQYDAKSDRWVMVMLGDDPGFVRGVLFIAVGASGDPTGGWRRFRMPVDSTGTFDPDIPYLAITADKIAITVNVWDGDTPINTMIYTMPKAEAFAGGLTITSTPTSFSFSPDLVPISSDGTALRFAIAVETSVVIAELSPNGALTQTSNFSAPVSFKSSTVCGQLGATLVLDCGYGTANTAVTRNGTTWIAVKAFENAALLWKISGTKATTYVIQEDSLAVGFPSVAVNRFGAALVGYVVTGPSIYASAAYRYIDPAGKISPMAMLKAGEAPFKAISRWGDYSTTVVDPIDDVSFWSVEIYANQGSVFASSRWATWWSYVKVAPETPRGRAVRH
jgi:hypothetical protein